MTLLASLCLLSPSALAASPDTQGGAAVYSSLRASVAVPTGYQGFATSYSAEVGAMFHDGNQLGLRFAWLPNPPDVYGAATPPQAVGPVAVWAYNAHITPTVDLAPSAALGAVFGQSPTTGNNKVLPYVQGGLAMRLRFPLPGGATIGAAPEIGFVPTILAPYMAFSVAYIGAPPAQSSLAYQNPVWGPDSR